MERAVKRERCSNWEREEKQLLRDILKPYIKIIENKDLSTNTNKQKAKAWCEITEKFNAVNTRIRDKKQLMNQWKVIKLTSKKELSQYRKESSRTGGGPPPPSPPPDTLEVVDMIPQEFEVDENIYDVDGVEVVIIEEDDINLDQMKSEESKDIGNIEPNTEASSSQPAVHPKISLPSTSTQRSAKKTQNSRKRNFNFAEASYEDMKKYRALENSRQEKEHEQRMKNMDEIHSQILRNLKIQEQIFNKMLLAYNKN